MRVVSCLKKTRANLYPFCNHAALGIFMSRGFLFFLPLFGLAACAAGPNPQTQAAALTGASEQTLIQHMGVPAKQMTVNGVNYLAYNTSYAQVDPNSDTGWYGWPYDNGNTLPTSVQFYACQTTFLVKSGKVFDYVLRGDGCD
jgi:hypothetical protein